jgi:hypothetical protein
VDFLHKYTKIRSTEVLSGFVRYKYSFHEYLYRFMCEAQQTPSIRLIPYNYKSSKMSTMPETNAGQRILSAPDKAVITEPSLSPPRESRAGMDVELRPKDGAMDGAVTAALRLWRRDGFCRRQNPMA